MLLLLFKYYKNRPDKSFKKKLGILTILFFIVFLSGAQNNPELLVEKILEDYLENASEEYDFSELQDILLNLYDAPILLNSADEEELRQLFFLNEGQIKDILEYRRKHLYFASIYELATIASIDKTSLSYMIPFISLKERSYQFSLKEMFTNSKQDVILKYERILEDKKGYEQELEESDKQYYTGSPYKLYARYSRNLYNKASFGLTMEKDPGEEFFKGSQKNGFDFYSAHFFLRDQGNLKCLAIGDFNANFGQGLILQSGFSSNKSPNVLDIPEFSQDITPYRSSNENNFFRGIAASYSLYETTITAFVSSKNIDGNLLETDSTENEEDMITSFFSSGYHRTPNELDKKQTVNEKILGLRASRNFNNLKLGLSGITGAYDPGVSVSDVPYQKYNFSGSSFTNLSTDYSLSHKNMYLFGELGWDTKHFALLNGLLINLGSKIKSGLIYRNYDKAYVANYANAFSEGSKTQNERGFFLALEINPVSNFKIKSYIDVFHFPWLKYQVDQPSYGHEYFADLIFNPSFYTKMYLRIKYEEKQKNYTDDEAHLSQLSDHKKLNLRYHIDRRINNRISIKSRVEYCRYEYESNISSGILSYVDLALNSANYKWKFITRYAVFNIDDYNTRIYAYENDILYSFSIPSFSGNGTRYYMVLKYHANDNLSFEIKYGRSLYFDKDSIGSGLEEIDGNHKSDLKMMLHYQF